MKLAFASRAKIVHIDVDPFEVGKSKQPHVSVCADVKSALKVLNNVLEGKRGKFYTLDFSEWRMELEEQYMQRQVTFLSSGDVIHPEYAIGEVLDTLTKRNRQRNVIVITGSGQHRKWAAQQYNYDWSRQWLPLVDSELRILDCRRQWVQLLADLIQLLWTLKMMQVLS